VIALPALLDLGGKRQILGLDSGVFYRECQNCGHSLPSKQFRLRTEAKTHSRRPFCLGCEKDKHSDRYKKNKNHHLSLVDKYRKNNWAMKMLWQAKASASAKNLSFNLDESDIVIPEFCKYLGIPLTQTLGEGVVWSNASLDRIDSSLGYVKGNVEVVSRKANTMKNMATLEELLVFSKNILKNHEDVK